MSFQNSKFNRGAPADRSPHVVMNYRLFYFVSRFFFFFFAESCMYWEYCEAGARTMTLPYRIYAKSLATVIKPWVSGNSTFKLLAIFHGYLYGFPFRGHWKRHLAKRRRAPNNYPKYILWTCYKRDQFRRQELQNRWQEWDLNPRHITVMRMNLSEQVSSGSLSHTP